MIQIVQSYEFKKWFLKLRDSKAKARINVALSRMEMGNFCNTKYISDGISEIKIDYGPGYRVYFIRSDEKLVVLLAGGDKGSQKIDIKKAKEIAKEWSF